MIDDVAEPMPSIVVIAVWWQLPTGTMHESIGLCLILFVMGSLYDITTVHDPHPPSSHPRFVPVKWTASDRKNAFKVCVGSQSLAVSWTGFPFKTNSIALRELENTRCATDLNIARE